MARRLMPALLLALVVSGLFTFWLSRHVAKGNGAAPAPAHRFVAVARAMEAGDQLQPNMLQMVDWPASQPLRGAFAKPEEVAGRILLSPVAAGEIVLDHHLAPAGSTGGLTAKIPPGMRAIALRSDEVAGVAGFLLPGTFVDVLVTYRKDNETSVATSTVLQNVRVLAAGQKMEPEPDGKPNAASVVTLLVTPQDAEKLTLASSLGKILFVLRNGADRKEVAGLNPQFSVGAPPAPRNAAPEPIHRPLKLATPSAPHYTVQTIAGGKLTEETFEGSAR